MVRPGWIGKVCVMDAGSERPIIIKKKKVIAGGGHHGGAWKVAYADFVTAMMAFFMLMWLLNATTEQQRKGIADYFTPTIALSRASGGGDGALNGNSVSTTSTAAASGRGGVGEGGGTEVLMVQTASQARESADLEGLAENLFGMGGESALIDNALKHIVTRLTDEGLVIEVYDLPGAPIFKGETDTPQPITEVILEVLARMFGIVSNDIAIQAHVRTESVLRVDHPIWDITTARSSRARLLLEEAGLDPSRIARITGEGDRDPVDDDITSVRNNRIEFIVLRSDQI